MALQISLTSLELLLSSEERLLKRCHPPQTQRPALLDELQQRYGVNILRDGEMRYRLITSMQFSSVECNSSSSWMSSFRSLGQRGSPCRLVFRSDACEDENCVAPLKGISEKRKRILQRDITVRDRRRIALAYISGYRGCTMRAHEWGG